MHSPRLFLIVLIASISTALADEASENDLKRLQGTWVAELRTPNPDKKLKLVLVVKDDTFSLEPQGEGLPKDRKVSGKIKVDASKSPREMDMTGAKSEAGKPAPDLLGIYKFEDSTLTFLPPARPGEPRPSEFIEDTGQGFSRLVVFRKQEDRANEK